MMIPIIFLHTRLPGAPTVAYLDLWSSSACDFAGVTWTRTLFFVFFGFVFIFIIFIFLSFF